MNRFPAREFLASVDPWLRAEGERSDGQAEVLEGAGCWAPTFPARADDFWLAATTSLRLIESLGAGAHGMSSLQVFEQTDFSELGVGYRRVPERGSES